MVEATAPPASQLSFGKRTGILLLLTLWTGVGFFAAQLIVALVIKGLGAAGVDFNVLDQPTFTATVAAARYLLGLAVVILGVRQVTKERITFAKLGLPRLPLWSELGLGVAGMFAYLLTVGLVMTLVMTLFTGFNIEQTQDVGFSMLSGRWQYAVAFVMLVVLAPFAEELLFRGFLYGKLRAFAPWWVSSLLVSLLFGAAHLQWNVAIDTFVLSMFMCGLRELCGSIWPGIIMHMMKNGMAFYFLFVNPTLLNLIGG